MARTSNLLSCSKLFFGTPKMRRLNAQPPQDISSPIADSFIGQARPRSFLVQNHARQRREVAPWAHLLRRRRVASACNRKQSTPSSHSLCLSVDSAPCRSAPSRLRLRLRLRTLMVAVTAPPGRESALLHTESTAGNCQHHRNRLMITEPRLWNFVG